MAKNSSKGKSQKHAFSGFKRDKKTLKAPFTQLSERTDGVFAKSNWHEVQLPEYIWVALILEAMETEEAISCLRGIADQWPSKDKYVGNLGPPGSLTSIAALTAPARKDLLTAVAKYVCDKSVLAPLCSLSGLPALDDWRSQFGADTCDDDWIALAYAVESSTQFHGEHATHICWFISCVGAASGQMIAADGIAEELEAIRKGYPENAGAVGGLFRAEAGNIRGVLDTAWCDAFWSEVFLKLQPATAPPEHQYLTDNDLGTAYYFTALLGHLGEHYWKTRNQSDDRVQEMAFGIVLAAVTTAYEVVELRTQNRFGGLAALRMATEATINLSYLAVMNDPELWLRFRRYGTGQAHLIATKLNAELGNAYCVDPKYMRAFLHEEDPNLFTDIQLGDWAGPNIRARAEAGKTKDLYDSYYDYSSSLLHGDWLGAATFGLAWDLNPLHRLQKVPRQFPRCLPSVVPDLCIVTNRLLEVLDELYPKFDFRLPEPPPRSDGSDAQDDR